MTNWIDWAFEQDLPTAEKLVLVHLAADVNTAGIGLWERERLQARCGYKKRSIQRLLKVLREAGILVDHSAWYRLKAGQTDGDYAGAVVSDLEGIELEHGGRPMTLREIADAEDGGPRPAIDGDAVGEAIAKHVIEAGEYLVDQLANFEHRLAEQITRLATLHVERAPAPPPPPPDPVKENPIYQELLATGMDEARAYRLSKADLEIDGDMARDPPAAAVHRPPETPREPERARPVAAVPSFPDNPLGRFQRILTLLHGSSWERHDTAENRKRWRALEDGENKHSVDGEVAAFEQLYPAIVDAARRLSGRATIEQFTDLQAVKEARAPWDQDPAPTLQDDAALEAEIQGMLRELEAFNDPRCTVQPRTTEKGEDGVTRTETTLGYHRRVSAKLREARKMKQMGIV